MVGGSVQTGSMEMGLAMTKIMQNLQNDCNQHFVTNSLQQNIKKIQTGNTGLQKASKIELHQRKVVVMTLIKWGTSTMVGKQSMIGMLTVFGCEFQEEHVFDSTIGKNPGYS